MQALTIKMPRRSHNAHSRAHTGTNTHTLAHTPHTHSTTTRNNKFCLIVSRRCFKQTLFCLQLNQSPATKTSQTLILSSYETMMRCALCLRMCFVFAIFSMLLQLIIQIKSIIMINCGSTLKILDFFALKNDVLVYLVDSHRPYVVDNILNESNVCKSLNI